MSEKSQDWASKKTMFPPRTSEHLSLALKITISFRLTHSDRKSIMALPKVKVVIVGAAGEIGNSIIKALLESDNFVRSTFYLHAPQFICPHDLLIWLTTRTCIMI